MQIDLDKTHKALLGLRDKGGAKALDQFHRHLQNFRNDLGVQLNDAEFRYVMQTLFNEQVVTVKADSELAKAPAITLEHGFSIRAVI